MNLQTWNLLKLRRKKKFTSARWCPPLGQTREVSFYISKSKERFVIFFDIFVIQANFLKSISYRSDNTWVLKKYFVRKKENTWDLEKASQCSGSNTWNFWNFLLIRKFSVKCCGEAFFGIESVYHYADWFFKTISKMAMNLSLFFEISLVAIPVDC